MSATMIRLRPKTLAGLREIARLTGESLQDALERAVEERQRVLYLEGLNADYEALQKDSKALRDVQRETALWDNTNLDGLEGL